MGIVLDSLKFYKLKNEHTARILFLVVYAFLLAFYLFPIGKPIDVQAYLKAVSDESAVTLPQITADNLLYFASTAGMVLVTGFFSLIYANCYVMQSEGFPSKKAVVASFRGIPKMIGFLLLLIAPAAISSLLAFIPLIYMFYALFFCPLLMTEGRMGIFEAIVESYRSTKGIKFSIFVNQIFLYFIMNLPITLATSIFYSTGNDGSIAEYMILSFLQAAYFLMSGRLTGKFYLLAIKNKDKLRSGTIDVLRDSGSLAESADSSKGDENDGNGGGDEDRDDDSGENNR